MLSLRPPNFITINYHRQFHGAIEKNVLRNERFPNNERRFADYLVVCDRNEGKRVYTPKETIFDKRYNRHFSAAAITRCRLLCVIFGIRWQCPVTFREFRAEKSADRTTTSAVCTYTGRCRITHTATFPLSTPNVFLGLFFTNKSHVTRMQHLQSRKYASSMFLLRFVHRKILSG